MLARGYQGHYRVPSGTHIAGEMRGLIEAAEDCGLSLTWDNEEEEEEGGRLRSRIVSRSCRVSRPRLIPLSHQQSSRIVD